MFDVGSLESRLELDRTPFIAGLRAARMEGQRFEREGITVNVDADTAGATEKIDRLASRDLEVKGSVDLDIGDALAKIEFLKHEVRSIGGGIGGIGGGGGSPMTGGPGGILGGAGGLSWRGLLLALGAAAPLVPTVGASAVQGALGAGALGLAGAGAGLVGGAGIFGAAAPAVARLKDLADAQGKVNDAIVNYGKDSTEAKTAQKELQNVQDAMPASAQRVMDSVDHLKSHWADLTMGAQRDFFGTLHDGLSEANRLLPMFAHSSERSMHAARGATDDFLASLNSPDFHHFIGTMTDLFVHGIHPVEVGAENIARVLGRIAVAAAPDFLDLLNGFADATHTWVQDTRDAGALRHTIHGYVNDFHEWLHLLGAVGNLLEAIFVGDRSTARQGDDVLQAMTDTLNGWSDWVNTHHAEINGFFREFNDTLGMFLSSVGEIAGTVLPAFKPIADVIHEIVSDLNSLKVGNVSALTVLLGLMAGKSLLNRLPIPGGGGSILPSLFGGAGGAAGTRGLMGLFGRGAGSVGTDAGGLTLFGGEEAGTGLLAGGGGAALATAAAPLALALAGKIIDDRTHAFQAGGAASHLPVVGGLFGQQTVPQQVLGQFRQRVSDVVSPDVLGAAAASPGAAGVSFGQSLIGNLRRTKGQVDQAFTKPLLHDWLMLPASASDSARQSAIGYARQLERSGQVPKGTAADLRDFFNRQWDDVAHHTRDAADNAVRFLSHGLNREHDTAHVAMRAINQVYEDGWNLQIRNQRQALQDSLDLTDRQWRQIAHKTKDGVDEVVHGVKTGYQAAAAAGAVGLGKLQVETNAALSALGISKDLNFAVSAAAHGATGGGGGHHRLHGGPIPGHGDGDKVPVWAEPGEYFVNKRAAAMFRPFLEAINSGIPRFAHGGMVTGDTQGLVPPFMSALGNMSAGTGHPINVLSGYRSRAEQARLYAAYLAGTGNLAAPPGSSHHELGIAADIAPGRETFGSVAGHYGLGFTVPSESWHIELLNAAAGHRGPQAQKLARIMLAGPAGAIRTTAQGSLDHAWHAAQRYVNAQAASSMGAGQFPSVHGGTGPVADIAGRVARQLHSPHDATLALFEALWAESDMGRSSSNVLQLLPSTAASYHIGMNDVAGQVEGFLTHGYYGRGGAIHLAQATSLAASQIAEAVQGSAFASGSNYAARQGQALGTLHSIHYPGFRKGGHLGPGETGVVGERGMELAVGRRDGGADFVGSDTIRRLSKIVQGSRRYEITITNWHRGEGYMREIADDEIQSQLDHEDHLAGMAG